MILTFVQKERQPTPKFEGKIKDVVVITGKGSSHASNGYLEYKGDKVEIVSNPHREKMNGKAVTQVVDIVQRSERVGYIYPDIVEQKRFLFLSFGYDYFVFNFKGKTYNAYEVGLGANEHYICVYKDNSIVAIIKKEDKKTNFCDQYIVYALGEENLLMLALLTLYFDCIRYPDHGEIMYESYRDDSFLTTQKELVDKYDASFIDRVKAME
ncbi:MAG: hypothetical protein IKJ59_13745 [Clostridia bacterium]|nr:hypothetical protein [Clostridia bacterium]